MAVRDHFTREPKNTKILIGRFAKVFYRIYSDTICHSDCIIPACVCNSD